MYKYMNIFSIAVFLMSIYVVYSSWVINKGKKNTILLIILGTIILSKLIGLNIISSVVIVIGSLLIRSVSNKIFNILLLIYIGVSFLLNKNTIMLLQTVEIVIAICIFTQLFKEKIYMLKEKEKNVGNKLNLSINELNLKVEKINNDKSITKNIKDKLDNKQKLLDTILSDCKSCIMIIDNNGHIHSDGDNFVKIWSQYKKYKKKITLKNFIQENIKDNNEFLHNIKNAKEFDKEITAEIKGTDGRYFEISFAPFILSKGKKGVICSVIDKTYEKKIKGRIKENNIKYKTIVDNIPYSILITDEKEILYNNNKNRGINFNSNNIKDIILEPSISGEIYYTRENLEQLYLDIDRVKFKDSQGNKNVVSIRNITEEKKLLKELEESKQKHESLVNIIPEGIYVLNLQNKNIDYLNDAAKNILKYVDKDKIEFESFMKDITVSTENQNESVKFKRKTIQNIYGKKTYLECGAMVIDVNKKLKLVGIIRDITSQVKTELLEKEIKIKQQENKSKNEFFINMSHELKTPLNVITSSNQLLEVMNKEYINNNPESDFTKSIGIIKKYSYMLIGLVDNIIDLAKLESDFHESKKDNYNLISLVEDICSDFSDYVKVNNIDILFDTEEEEKIANVDPNDVEKIILTLLSMVIRYLKCNSTVNVDLRIVDNKSIISIKNKGRYDYKRYINDNDRKSLDVGVEVCKSIITLYGGAIDIKFGLNNDIEIIVEFKIEDDINNYKERTKNACDDYIYTEYLRMCNIVV